jgi:SM-20-related protein
MLPAQPLSALQSYADEEVLFEQIANNLQSQGYAICPASLPVELGQKICEQLYGLDETEFTAAAIGRQNLHMKNEFVRTDRICWFTGETPTGARWLAWANRLQSYLNRRLFLGLFSFESHLAHYSAGDFYKRHYDAFRDQRNRVLSMVVYLNPNWGPEDGGDLVLYQNDADTEGLKVTPLMGTVVLFLSEEFPHEVLPAKRDRYSIAGWYRVNGSTSVRVDPPS